MRGGSAPASRSAIARHTVTEEACPHGPSTAKVRHAENRQSGFRTLRRLDGSKPIKHRGTPPWPQQNDPAPVPRSTTRLPGLWPLPERRASRRWETPKTKAPSTAESVRPALATRLPESSGPIASLGLLLQPSPTERSQA